MPGLLVFTLDRTHLSPTMLQTIIILLLQAEISFSGNLLKHMRQGLVTEGDSCSAAVSVLSSSSLARRVLLVIGWSCWGLGCLSFTWGLETQQGSWVNLFLRAEEQADQVLPLLTALTHLCGPLLTPWPARELELPINVIKCLLFVKECVVFPCAGICYGNTLVYVYLCLCSPFCESRVV